MGSALAGAVWIPLLEFYPGYVTAV